MPDASGSSMRGAAPGEAPLSRPPTSRRTRRGPATDASVTGPRAGRSDGQLERWPDGQATGAGADSTLDVVPDERSAARSSFFERRLDCRLDSATATISATPLNRSGTQKSAPM